MMLHTFLIYNGILFFSTFFVLLYEKNKSRSIAGLFLAVAFLVIFVPAAIRYNIGADYWSYAKIFNEFNSSYGVKQEIGFELLLAVLHFLNLPVEYFFVITSFVIYFFLFLAYPKNGATLYHFMYMVSFYLVSYNLIRTAIVLSLILYFIKLYIEKRNFIVQIVLIIIAFLFHKSAVLIMLPLFLIAIGFHRIFYNKTVIFFAAIVVGIIFLFRYSVFDWLMRSGVVELFGYENYLSSNYYKEAEFHSGLGFWLKASPLLIMLFYSKRFVDRYGSVAITSAFLLFIAYIGMAAVEIISRVQRFFIFGNIFAVLVFYLSRGIRHRKIILLYCVLLGLLFYQIDINSHRSDQCGGSRISPYVSLFNKADDRSWSGIEHGSCINW